MMMTSDEKEFVELSWVLIECKLIYYNQGEYGPSVEKYLGLSDADYDFLERRYVELSDKLGRENTVQNMVGVDMDRPSVQFVHSALKKFQREYQKNPKHINPRVQIRHDMLNNLKQPSLEDFF